MEIINITPNISITSDIDLKSNTENHIEQSNNDNIDSIIDNAQVSIGIKINF